MAEEYTGSGNARLGGSATVVSSHWTYVASGGLGIGGETNQVSPSWQWTGSGSLNAGSSAPSAATADYATTASGGLSLGGTAPARPIFTYVASGGLGIRGASSSFYTKTITKTFTWSVSEGVLRTFRVEGKCRPANHPCPPTSNPTTACGSSGGTMQFVANVQAHSVTDLCNKLKDRGFLGPIKKVQMWSLPVNKSDWGDSDSKDCNKLSDVNFGVVPECLDFTVDEDVSAKAGVGSYLIFQSFFTYDASGGLGVGKADVAKVTSPYYSYEASGGLGIGGSSTPDSPQFFSYEASGGLGVKGASSYYGSDYGTAIAVAGVGAEVLELMLSYGRIDAPTLKASTDLVDTDCCENLSVPQILYVKHELHRSDRLARFLRVNSFTLPKSLNMMYSQQRDSWYSSTHFRGDSVIQGQRENWDIVFEFGCLAEDAILGVPKDVWGFSVSVQCRNITNSTIEVTRLVLEFDPELVCNFSGSLKFDFSLNTKTQVTTPAVIRAVVFMDSLGAFIGTTYLRNPVTIFEVGSSVPNFGTGMFDQSVPYQKVLLSTL